MTKSLGIDCGLQGENPEGDFSRFWNQEDGRELNGNAYSEDFLRGGWGRSLVNLQSEAEGVNDFEHDGAGEGRAFGEVDHEEVVHES